VLALGVIFSKQAVHSLLCLISIFFNTVILYLYTGAEFLAFLFLIVYVGAIAILFLFVIMLLHIKKPEAPKMPRTITPFFILVFGTCVGIDDAVSYSLEDFFTKSTALVQKSEPNSLETLT
jgi:NADH-quinone oxidoreductase subunit J